MVLRVLNCLFKDLYLFLISVSRAKAIYGENIKKASISRMHTRNIPWAFQVPAGPRRMRSAARLAEESLWQILHSTLLAIKMPTCAWGPT